MRINAGSQLTASDVQEAAISARTRHGQDIYVEEMSTSPRGAITFYCEAEHGRFATNRRGNGGYTGRAATWTAWGWLIADLFRRDPGAKIGQYKNVEDFRAWCTREAERAAAVGGDESSIRWARERNVDFLELVEGVSS